MENPEPHLNEEAGKAFDEGVTAGLHPDARAGECPYSHDRFTLRFQWMDGFAEGRKQAARGISANRSS